MIDSVENRNIIPLDSSRSDNLFKLNNSHPRHMYLNAAPPENLLFDTKPTKKNLSQKLPSVGNKNQRSKPAVPQIQTPKETERLATQALYETLMTPSNQSIATIPLEISIKRPPLTVLDLSSNDLKAVPPELLQVSTLYILKLQHNKLESLPDGIEQLVDLETLNVSFNHLKALPKTLCKLTRLKELNIEANHITSFSREITDLSNLKVLNILHNSLEKFPTSFHNLDSLITFFFEWFAYTEPAFDRIQKGKDAQKNIEALKQKCKELSIRNISFVAFPEFLSLLSQTAINLNAEVPEVGTYLHKACFSGDLSVAKYLLHLYPDLLNAENEAVITPFCATILNNHTQLALYLLQRGADHRKGGGVHGSPLIIATKRGNLTLVREILKRGEDPNKKDLNLNTALHHSVMIMSEGNYNATFIAQELLDFGASPNLPNREKWTPLHLAARRKSLKAVKWLLGYNFEVQELHGRDELFKINKKGGPYNWTPLHIAAYSNNPEIVELLADAGVNMFKRSLFGYAAKNGINKPGLTLKLCQKFEKEWIKKNVFRIRRPNTEERAHSNLREIDIVKNIRMASRNRFDDPFDIRKSRCFIVDSKRETNDTTDISSEQFAPIWQSHQMEKIGNDDLIETMPPTETSFDMDFCAVESDAYNSVPQETVRQNDIDEDTEGDVIMFANAIPKFGEKAKLLDKSHQPNQGKFEKKSDYIFSITEKEFKEKLLTEVINDQESCSKEIQNLRDNLLSLEIDAMRKVKVLKLLQIFHQTILEYLYSKSSMPVQRALLPFYILQETSDKSPKIGAARSRNNQIIALCNIVPETLINTFKSLNNIRNESIFLKMQICKALEKIIHLPSLSFLEQVLNDHSESINVKREARHCIKVLKLYQFNKSTNGK